MSAKSKSAPAPKYFTTPGPDRSDMWVWFAPGEGCATVVTFKVGARRAYVTEEQAAARLAPMKGTLLMYDGSATFGFEKQDGAR